MSQIVAPLVEIDDPHVSPQGAAEAVGAVHGHGGAGHGPHGHDSHGHGPHGHGDHGHADHGHPHAAGASHGHSHAGAPAHSHSHSHASFRPPFSLVRLSLVGRLGIALTLSGVVWAAVLWAVQPIGR